MSTIAKLRAISAVCLLSVSCAPDQQNTRNQDQSGDEEIEQESLQLSSSSAANRKALESQNAQIAMTKVQDKLLNRLKGGNVQGSDIKNLESQMLNVINSKLKQKSGSKSSSVSAGQFALSSIDDNSDSLQLAQAAKGTKTSQLITPQMICASIYAEGSAQYMQCVTQVTAAIGSGITDVTYDPVLPAVRVASFPLTIPGVGSGMCVYARVSVLAVGIACANASGGVWAGCDVWNGCGSGEF